MSTWEIVPRADLIEDSEPFTVSALSLVLDQGFFLFQEGGIKFAVDAETVASIARIAFAVDAETVASIARIA